MSAYLGAALSDHPDEIDLKRIGHVSTKLLGSY